MKIERLENPGPEVIEFFDKKIDEFNWLHWEVDNRLPLAVQIKNEQGDITAGAAARSFGDWLLLDNLWVSEELRGQHVGTRILKEIELMGQQRGCVKCLLTTLNFQAMPFYLKHGYETQWIQEGYPKTGCKYFMVKEF